MPKICVKWGGKKFDVDANTDLEPLVLKSQLFELTNVLPERQKVMIKGRILKDDTWEDITLRDGLVIMMMGSCGELPKLVKPEEAMDVSSTESVKEKVILPAGLKNLGNTCYMNACLQSFRAIPELMGALKAYSGNDSLISTAKKLYQDLNNLDKSADDGKSYIPFFLLNVLHNTFPQFATRDNRGQFQQQDANECFSEVLRVLSGNTEVNVEGSNDGPKKVKASRIFEIEFDVEWKCLENADEPKEKSTESHMQLSCFLGQDVKYIQSGIRNRLTEEVEKQSPTLGRDAKYMKESLIRRLPEYLCIQIVRFFYKAKDNVNAKILKDVKFPINLDVQESCTEELRNKLQPMRDRYKQYDDKKIEELRKSKLGDEKDAGEKDEKEQKFWPNSFSDDPGSNNSGFYELKAVITHKGRSSDSGHYVSWIRIGPTQWVMCDDDEVHPVTEEEVLKLSGGGDWHCAYVLVYGPRRLPMDATSD